MSWSQVWWLKWIESEVPWIWEVKVEEGKDVDLFIHLDVPKDFRRRGRPSHLPGRSHVGQKARSSEEALSNRRVWLEVRGQS